MVNLEAKFLSIYGRVRPKNKLPASKIQWQNQHRLDTPTGRNWKGRNKEVIDIWVHGKASRLLNPSHQSIGLQPGLADLQTYNNKCLLLAATEILRLAVTQQKLPDICHNSDGDAF